MLMLRPSARQLADRRDALRGRRDLHHHVRAVDSAPEPVRLASSVRPVSPAREGRTSIETKPSRASGLVVGRPQQVGGGLHVGDDQPVEDLDRRQPAGGQGRQVVVVALPSGDRLLEDRRVGGHPRDPDRDQLGQAAARDQLAADHVQPDALPQVVKCVETSLAAHAATSGLRPRVEPAEGTMHREGGGGTRVLPPPSSPVIPAARRGVPTRGRAGDGVAGRRVRRARPPAPERARRRDPP